MHRLEPITKIHIDLGTPADFSPPSTSDFIKAVVDEANAVEERYMDTYGVEDDFWMESLTPDEKAAYARLEAAESEAEQNYNPNLDNLEDMRSEPAKAYFKACDARERFYESHGRHICYKCSYYTKQREDTTHTAECFKLRKAVRPFCSACQSFTIGYTPEDRKIDEQERIYLAAHPKEAERLRRKRDMERAKEIASDFRTNNESARFVVYYTSVKKGSNIYEDAYRRFPEVFKDTKYPTFVEFKAAAEAYVELHSEWKKTIDGYYSDNEDTTTP